MRLTPITRENWLECIGLEREPGQQGFVASNLYSLAQAGVEAECVPLAIYAGQVMIGFLMYEPEAAPGVFWISRFMIDRRHQGRGYGARALRLLIDRLRTHGAHTIRLGLVPGNTAAHALYRAAGFRDTGERIHGEVILSLTVGRGEAG